MWITVWNAATLNWILCQLWLSTINTINNRKDRLHARKTGCNHSACVAHRPHPPPFLHRIYISKQASVCTAQPLALLRSASLSQSISVSISLSRKHSSLAAQVLGLKIVRQLRAMPTATSRDVDCSASTDCAHSPLACVYVFYSLPRLLFMRNYFLREAKWNGSTSLSTLALMLFPFVCCCYCDNDDSNKNKRNNLWFIHSCFFPRVSHRVLMFFYSSFCFVLQSSSAVRYSNLFHFHWHWFLFFLSFLLLFGVILDNCHTGSVRVSSFFLVLQEVKFKCSHIVFN